MKKKKDLLIGLNGNPIEQYLTEQLHRVKVLRNIRENRYLKSPKEEIIIEQFEKALELVSEVKDEQ